MSNVKILPARTMVAPRSRSALVGAAIASIASIVLLGPGAYAPCIHAANKAPNVAASGASAGEVVLKLVNGGQMRGRWLNADEPAATRKTYQIVTGFGGRFSVAVEQVEEAVAIPVALIEYERVRPTFPDTVEGQWEAAEWCKDRQLRPQREAHLERIIELDPEHERARLLLGYQRRDGKWLTRDDLMIGRGYVKGPKGWELPQEVKLREERRKRELAEREWMARLKTWRGWLSGDKAPAARENITSIDDPFALKAIGHYMDVKNERHSGVRLLFVDALANIGVAGHGMLVQASLYDPEREVRLTAMERLAKAQSHEAVRSYIGYLRDADNVTVNRAALGLSYLNDPSAVSPLIDALVTTHKFVETKGGGGYTASFSSAGSGFSSGSSSTLHIARVSNESVRDTLVRLTGANFNFDIAMWRSWYNSQRKATPIDTRRD